MKNPTSVSELYVAMSRMIAPELTFGIMPELWRHSAGRSQIEYRVSIWRDDDAFDTYRAETIEGVWKQILKGGHERSIDVPGGLDAIDVHAIETSVP